MQYECINCGSCVDACSTVGLIGNCNEVGDPVIPDLINHFYLSPTASDPVAYAQAKEQACIDAGGVWEPVN